MLSLVLENVHSIFENYIGLFLKNQFQVEQKKQVRIRKRYFPYENILCTLAKAAYKALALCTVLIHSVVSDSLPLHGLQPTRLLCPWDSPGQNTRMGSHSLLQGIFPTQESNPGVLPCRQIFYHLSHKRTPNFRYMPQDMLISNTKW